MRVLPDVVRACGRAATATCSVLLFTELQAVPLLPGAFAAVGTITPAAASTARETAFCYSTTLHRVPIRCRASQNGLARCAPFVFQVLNRSPHPHTTTTTHSLFRGCIFSAVAEEIEFPDTVPEEIENEHIDEDTIPAKEVDEDFANESDSDYCETDLELDGTHSHLQTSHSSLLKASASATPSHFHSHLAGLTSHPRVCWPALAYHLLDGVFFDLLPCSVRYGRLVGILWVLQRKARTLMMRRLTRKITETSASGWTLSQCRKS